MASSSITLYDSAAGTMTFLLVSSSVNETVWKAAGRSLSTPLELKLARKLNSGTKNDTILVQFRRIERNVTTSQLATAQFKCELSVPKDQTILTPAILADLLGYASSLFNDGAALAATEANRGAIVDGRDV